MTSSQRLCDPQRIRGPNSANASETMKFFVNIDCLVSISKRPHNFAEDNEASEAGALRRLGGGSFVTVYDKAGQVSCYARARPFANLFVQILTNRADTVIFSDWKNIEMFDAVLDQLGWTGAMRAGGLLSPSSHSVGVDAAAGSSALYGSGGRTFDDLGIRSAVEHRSVIIDTSTEKWHPLLRPIILLAPRQDALKSLPRFVEPFGLLSVLSTSLEVLTSYESSLNEDNTHQLLHQITSTRFEAWKVFVPPEFSTSSGSSSSRIKIIVASGGGKIVRTKQDANMIAFVPSTSSSSSSSSAAAHRRGASASLLQSNSNLSTSTDAGPPTAGPVSAAQTAVCTPDPHSQCELVHPMYFEACAALGYCLPTVCFLAPGAQPSTSCSTHPRDLKGWWEWMSSLSPLPSFLTMNNQQRAAVAEGVDSMLLEVKKEEEGAYGGDDGGSYDYDDEDSSPSSSPPKSRAAKLSANKKSNNNISTVTATGAAALRPPTARTLVSSLPTDWVSSVDPITQRIKNDTFFVASWMIARCVAPYSRAVQWLPVRTLSRALEMVRVEVSLPLLCEVVDSKALMKAGIGAGAAGGGGGGSMASCSAASSVRPGYTNLVLSSDSSFIARGDVQIHPQYTGSSSARTAIRTNELYFRHACVQTEGDERAQLPMKKFKATQTELPGYGLPSIETQTDDVEFFDDEKHSKRRENGDDGGRRYSSRSPPQRRRDAHDSGTDDDEYDRHSRRHRRRSYSRSRSPRRTRDDDDDRSRAFYENIGNFYQTAASGDVVGGIGATAPAPSVPARGAAPLPHEVSPAFHGHGMHSRQQQQQQQQKPQRTDGKYWPPHNAHQYPPRGSGGSNSGGRAGTSANADGTEMLPPEPSMTPIMPDPDEIGSPSDHVSVGAVATASVGGVNQKPGDRIRQREETLGGGPSSSSVVTGGAGGGGPQNHNYVGGQPSSQPPPPYSGAAGEEGEAGNNAGLRRRQTAAMRAARGRGRGGAGGAHQQQQPHQQQQRGFQPPPVVVAAGSSRESSNDDFFHPPGGMARSEIGRQPMSGGAAAAGGGNVPTTGAASSFTAKLPVIAGGSIGVTLSPYELKILSEISITPQLVNTPQERSGLQNFAKQLLDGAHGAGYKEHAEVLDAVVKRMPSAA